MGEICAIQMFGPSHCFQRSQLASSSIRVRRLLQSLAPAPLVGPGSSMRRGKAPSSASMPKDRRGTCAWRVTPHLPRCCMTIFCAPQLWIAFWLSKIPQRAAQAIKRASSIYISSVSVFEIALKASVGELNIPFREFEVRLATSSGAQRLRSRGSMRAGPTILQASMPTRSTAYCERRRSSSRFTCSARTRISLDAEVSL
jgi:hypothetical protein